MLCAAVERSGAADDNEDGNARQFRPKNRLTSPRLTGPPGRRIVNNDGVIVSS